MLTAFVYPHQRHVGVGRWLAGQVRNGIPRFCRFGFGARGRRFCGSGRCHRSWARGSAGLSRAVRWRCRVTTSLFAALGVFILWVGWYGFNPGSQLAFAGEVNTHATMLIAVNTTLAAAAGAVAPMIVAWILFKKPDLTMALNGALAGLVGITANCDAVTNLEAIVIGAVAGVLVVAGILLLDKLRIDDPVGAFPVHGLCGVWGGIATGIFGEYELRRRRSSVRWSIPLWAFATMAVLFLGLKAVGILRVSPEDERPVWISPSTVCTLIRRHWSSIPPWLRPGHRFRFLQAVGVELGKTSALPRVFRGSRCWIHLRVWCISFSQKDAPTALGG